MNGITTTELGALDETRPLTLFGVDGLAPADDGKASLSHVTVLMVDDEPLMTDLVQVYLEEAGYRHFVAVNDAHQALEAARRHRPGLILLDLMMPGLSGFEVLAQLRAEPALRYTPVIVLTASSETTHKLRALELGASEFLAKPVNEVELAIRVRNSLVLKVYHDRLANEDPVTGLPNRGAFVEQLEATLSHPATQQRMGLLHINLDRFRQVNDSLGHAAGDSLLAAVARRLRRVARQSGSAAQEGTGDEPQVARLGGDEFAVLLPALGSADDARRVARRLLAAMGKAFSVQGQDVFITPSIGIALYPDDGVDGSTLLRSAGVAMKYVKDGGRNSLHFYSHSLNDASLENLQLETDLRRAVERRELVLHYQPKVEMASGRIVGAEALMRWNHPRLGLLPPARFIPIAEETGLIVDISHWLVEHACEQMAQWRDALGLSLPVAVNVARHGLVSGALEDVVRQALLRHCIPHGHLVLELTESMLMDRLEVISERLAALRALGVELSIDDFGTGYSSMSYLKRFPVQELKIDRSFVSGTPTDRADAAIVRALVVLGHSLELRVVAEGVETEAQRKALQQLGCDHFQGYLCSRPVPAAEFVAKLQAVHAAL
jgi:diguanylate cyclase